MALHFKQLGQVYPEASTLTTLYTLTAPSTQCILSALDICNTTTGSITCRVFLVPNGASAEPSNALLYDLAVPANSTVSWAGNQALKDVGSTIVVYATTEGLCFTASGLED